MPVPPKPSLRIGAASVEGRAGKDDLATELSSLEEELEELKVKYEMYFLGSERREPVQKREELKKRVLRAKTAFTRNAGLRFKVQSLHARYLSYERLWLRAGREKEEGTYRRDLFKARMRARPAPASPAPGAAPSDVPAHAAEGGAPAVNAAAPAPAASAAAPSPAPRPAVPRPPAARAQGGKLGDAQMRELYDAYVAAKRRCNEDVSRLSYEAVSRSVANQIPGLMEKHQAKSVDFRVVIKDGKALLKAIPRS